jgi:hypothetical protein
MKVTFLSLEIDNIKQVGMMKQKKLHVVLPVVVAALIILPLQLRVCIADEASETVVLKGKGKTVVAPPEEVDSGMSTPMMIGIGVGVAALAGGAVALGSSSGGGDDGGAAPAPAVNQTDTPPAADQLVAAWDATANQPGSGLTYTGVYHLYQGGPVGYDILISDGEHLVGGGNWWLQGYTLTIITDHGSRYMGDFQPGNINSVDLNATTGWNLHLAR